MLDPRGAHVPRAVKPGPLSGPESLGSALPLAQERRRRYRGTRALCYYKNGPVTLGTLTYDYDSSGNRRQIGGTWARTGLPQPLASVTYDAANRPLTFGGATPTHDLNGNLTSDGSTNFTWDARNRLTGLNGPSVTGSFQYDAVGRRASRTLNGTTSTVLHDRLDVVQETHGVTVRSILTGARIAVSENRSQYNGRLTSPALHRDTTAAPPCGVKRSQRRAPERRSWSISSVIA